MKRIAFFQSDLRVGGIQKSVVNILNEIDYSKCHVDLYLYDDKCFFDVPSHENLNIYYLPPMPRYYRLLYFGLVKALSKDVTGGKEYDVAVDFSSYRNECAVGVIKANAKKRIMWIHNDVEIKRKNEPKYRVLWHFFKGKLKYYDAFAAVSPGIIDGFRKVTGIWDKPIVSIPNHIDTGEIFRKVDADIDFTVDKSKLNLCTVGRICHQKAFDVTMEYLAEVKKQRPNIHFYLIGDGPDREALKEQIHTLGLENEVTLLGNQPNPFPYMNKMDGFVLNSRYEGQGMVIWEAKTLGLPLYISRNLEAYNPGITGCDSIVQALLNAQKPEKKVYDDLSSYNEEISKSIFSLLELDKDTKETGTPSAASKRSGILICGSYGLGNAGDESILKAILQDVRSVAPNEEIIVLSRNPAETSKKHNVKALHMFNLPAVWAVMRHVKVYINGGGNLIQDVTSRRSLWYYLYTLRAAKNRGCKVLMYGCGIGPVNHPKDVIHARNTLNKYVDMITLREDSSLKELERFGVTKPEISLASDPALLLPRADDTAIDAVMQKHGLDPHGQYFGVCLRPWSGFHEKAPVFASAVRHVKETYGLTPVFISINHNEDGAAADQVISLLGESACAIRTPLGTEVTLGVISRMQVVLSMRLHGLIFAAGQGIPLVGVVYDPKVRAFLSYMNQELCEDLNHITAESLCENLDKAIAMRENPAAIEAAIAHLRVIGQRNRDALSRLINS